MTPTNQGTAIGVAPAAHANAMAPSLSDAADPLWSEAFWPTECQRLLLQTALLPRARALAAWIEWRSRYDFFDHPHGDGAFKLYPLVYKRLVAERFDEPLLPRLKGIYRYWWSANQRLFGMASDLLELMHRSAIRTLVLKGGAICPLYYKDVGSRPMSDIDVLVKLDQVGRALMVLQQAGWRPVTPSVLNDVRFRHSVEMRNAAGQEFDLHWHAFRECLASDSDDEMWQRARPIQLGRARTLAPDATDTLLHTIVHGIRWNPEPSIRWIPDSMAILRAVPDEIDWDRMLDQADRHRIRVQLHAGLRYLRDTVEAPIPDRALARLSAIKPTALERMEYHYVSLGAEQRERMFFGYLPFFVVEFWRWSNGKSLGQRTVGLPWYLIYRLRSQPDLVHPTIRGWARGLRASIWRRSKPVDANEEQVPAADAWRYFESCSHGLRRVFLFGLVAAAQSLLVLPVILLVRHSLDVVIPRGQVQMLLLIGAAIFGLRLANSVISLFLRRAYIRLIKDAVLRLREDLLARLYLLSRFTYSRRDRMEMHARIVNDTERLDNMANNVASKFLPAMFSALALVGLLGYLNWKLLVMLLVLAPVLLVSARITGGVVRQRVYIFQRAFEKFAKGVSFILQHMDLTRVQSYEQEETKRRVSDLRKLKTAAEDMAFSFAIHGQAQSMVITLCGIALLVLGGSMVATHKMTLGEFFSFWLAAGLLSSFINTITEAIPDMITGNESMRTLYRVAHTGERVPYRGRRRIPFEGRIELRDVEFAYGNSPVLRGVTLEITPGANIAIIGSNGAGKSTILYMILGFYRPWGGQVLADGVPYEELDLAELRRGIGVVMQHPTFFPGTILDLITYGNPDASMEDVRRAARLALADDFIQRLPKGYDTEVGEDAMMLSGGEAQRLAIARALLRQPKVLVLDEPTNHLEMAAIDRLMSNLSRIENRPAIVTISHDAQVLRHAHVVYSLEEGRLRSSVRVATPAPVQAAVSA